MPGLAGRPQHNWGGKKVTGLLPGLTSDASSAQCFWAAQELRFTDFKRAAAAMKTANDRFSTADEGNVVADLLCSAVLIIWGLVRMPILIVLAFLEPFVRFVLTGIAILSVLTALVFKGSSAPPPIPFWVMMCVSLGCVMLVPAYHFILRLLSR